MKVKSLVDKFTRDNEKRQYISKGTVYDVLHEEERGYCVVDIDRDYVILRLSECEVVETDSGIKVGQFYHMIDDDFQCSFIIKTIDEKNKRATAEVIMSNDGNRLALGEEITWLLSFINDHCEKMPEPKFKISNLENEMVDNPSHYNKGKYEAIEVIESSKKRRRMSDKLTIDLSDFETNLKMELTLTSSLKDFNELTKEFVNGLELCLKNCEEKGIKGKLNFSIIKED